MSNIQREALVVLTIFGSIFFLVAAAAIVVLIADYITTQRALRRALRSRNDCINRICAYMLEDGNQDGDGKVIPLSPKRDPSKPTPDKP